MLPAQARKLTRRGHEPAVGFDELGESTRITGQRLTFLILRHILRWYY